MDEIRYQVFISSTASDLQPERQKVWETLVALGFLVSGMEAFPATNNEQFKYIENQISASDYYVLIVGGRYGTINDDGVSFTEREFDYAQSIQIPTLVFPVRDISALPVSKTDQDVTKSKSLEKFREKVIKNRLCHLWSNPDDLALGIVKAVQNAIKENPRAGWRRGNDTDVTQLLSEIRQLRIENDKLQADKKQEDKSQASSELIAELQKPYTFDYSLKINPQITKKSQSISTRNSIRSLNF